MNPIRTLLFKILLLLVSLESIVLITNILVDPAHLIDRSAKDISEQILSGRNIAQYPNDLDFRNIHINSIRSDRFHPRVISVGSSRGWQISQDLFHGTTFYNACVGSANLTDYMAIYHMLARERKLPDTLIIAIDPWVIDDSRGAEQNLQPYTVFNYDFRSLAVEIGVLQRYKLFSPGMLVSKYLNPNCYTLLSFNYFQSSLQNIFSNNKRFYRVVNNADDTCKLLLSDASIVYPKWFSELPPDSVIGMARSFAEKETQKKSDVSELNLRLIRAFVQKIKKDGVVPLLFLTPYNPFAYDIINDYNGSLVKDEQAVRKLALSESIRCIGTYNPHLCNFDISYFYDYYHMKKKGINELYRKG